MGWGGVGWGGVGGGGSKQDTFWKLASLQVVNCLMRLSLLKEVWGLVPSLKTPKFSPAQKNYPGSYASLRADEIKLWLTPSAKQRRNPCSGLPAVYPDLSTRHDWPVKKDLCFVCRDRQSGWREIPNAFPVIRWVLWGFRTRISVLLRRRYKSEFTYRLHAGY